MTKEKKFEHLYKTLKTRSPHGVIEKLVVLIPHLGEDVDLESHTMKTGAYAYSMLVHTWLKDNPGMTIDDLNPKVAKLFKYITKKRSDLTLKKCIAPRYEQAILRLIKTWEMVEGRHISHFYQPFALVADAIHYFAQKGFELATKVN